MGKLTLIFESEQTDEGRVDDGYGEYDDIYLYSLTVAGYVWGDENQSQEASSQATIFEMSKYLFEKNERDVQMTEIT
jgi:hypothetical protein